MMIQAVRPARKHLALLAALVGMMVAQPLVGHRSVAGGVYFLPRGVHTVSEVAYHSFMVAFLGFAVAVILRDLFAKSVISGDDVIGAICGYLLLGLVWANLYTLTTCSFPAPSP